MTFTDKVKIEIKDNSPSNSSPSPFPHLFSPRDGRCKGRRSKQEDIGRSTVSILVLRRSTLLRRRPGDRRPTVPP